MASAYSVSLYLSLSSSRFVRVASSSWKPTTKIESLSKLNGLIYDSDASADYDFDLK